MDIGSILSRAGQIIWRHKVLWIFGILASCGSNANSGGSNSGMRYESGQLPPQMEQFFTNLTDWQIALIVGGIILVVLLFILLAVFLGTLGRIGLIRGTMLAGAEPRADRLQEPRLLFGDLFNDSMRYFWRVFLLNLLIGIVLFLAFGIFLALGVLGSIATLGIGALCFIPLICLLVPLGWFIGIVIEQANVAIVAENLGVMDGLRRGWEVVRANLGSMLIMGLVLTIGGLIAGLVIGLPLALAIGPAVASAVMSGGDPGTGGWVTTALCLVAYLPILLVLNGILRGYISSAWTLTFLQLARPTIQEPVPTPAL